jgi:hypothetical protein
VYRTLSDKNGLQKFFDVASNYVYESTSSWGTEHERERERPVGFLS